MLKCYLYCYYFRMYRAPFAALLQSWVLQHEEQHWNFSGPRNGLLSLVEALELKISGFCLWKMCQRQLYRCSARPQAPRCHSCAHSTRYAKNAWNDSQILQICDTNYRRRNSNLSGLLRRIFSFETQQKKKVVAGMKNAYLYQLVVCSIRATSSLMHGIPIWCVVNWNSCRFVHLSLYEVTQKIIRCLNSNDKMTLSEFFVVKVHSLMLLTCSTCSVLIELQNNKTLNTRVQQQNHASFPFSGSPSRKFRCLFFFSYLVFAVRLPLPSTCNRKNICIIIFQLTLCWISIEGGDDWMSTRADTKFAVVLLARDVHIRSTCTNSF